MLIVIFHFFPLPTAFVMTVLIVCINRMCETLYIVWGTNEESIVKYSLFYPAKWTKILFLSLFFIIIIFFLADNRTSQTHKVTYTVINILGSGHLSLFELEAQERDREGTSHVFNGAPWNIEQAVILSAVIVWGVLTARRSTWKERRLRWRARSDEVKISLTCQQVCTVAFKRH